MTCADGIAATQFDLAKIDLKAGNLESAISRLIESWSVVLKTGRVDGIAAVGELLGQSLVAADEQEKAAGVLFRCVEAYQKLERDADARRIEQIIAELSLPR